MIGQLLRSDFLKIKRKGLWLLTLIGPLGVVFLQMVNYAVRKDYLLQQSDDNWHYYLLNVNAFTPLALVLGIVILTSLMASVENETNAWKQLIALPVSKMAVYLSKFTVLLVLLFVASVLLLIFTLSFGMYLDLGDEMPYVSLIKFSFYPYLAALPVLALHLWIALVSRHQGIPVTMGVIGVILTYMAYNLPNWMIWKWPALMQEWAEPAMIIWLGIGCGLLLYVAGMVHFVRKDVS
ncbi:ABC transporter permease [Lentibacillus sp.]|uniref:ABC transporter permease n=1 Tax=Lentibacillus sp. TaxID=1925746 RepID=UPI002B4B70D9|nr:ABC transporter permease [Lentibacillus sp.]HLS09097.1 ABC transporter permease [Lentibacillus sp.]